MSDSKEIKFEIVKRIGVIGPAGQGWTRELNLVSWNGRESKLDIRDWNEDHTRMGKGLTLTADEAHTLKRLLGEVVD